MSVMEATISLMQVMPKQEQSKVYAYAKTIVDKYAEDNPFHPLTIEDVLNDLAISRQQIAEGKCRNMSDALEDMGKAHGFV